MNSPFPPKVEQRFTPAHNPPPAAFTKNTLIWAVAHFAFYFIQQLAEALAPLFLIIGIGWSILPKLVDSLLDTVGQMDPQAHEVTRHMSGIVPDHLYVGGHYLSSGSLIFDGIFLMLLAAAGATLTAFLGRNS